jgi:hypothetical protein
MATQAQIIFGSKTYTVSKKNLEEERKKALVSIAETGKKVTENDKEIVNTKIRSQYENEKDILKQLFQTYAAKVSKSIDTLCEVSNILDNIEESDTTIFFTEHEVDMLKQGLESLDELPPVWTLYGELFKQLKNPQFNKTIIDGKGKTK